MCSPKPCDFSSSGMLDNLYEEDQDVSSICDPYLSSHDDDDRKFVIADESCDETDEDVNEGAGIKEQMYLFKLSGFKNQIQQLKDNNHPEYVKQIQKIDANFKERMKVNDLWRESERENVRSEYERDKTATTQDFKEKEAELLESLLTELEEKRKIIEIERYSLDLNSDSLEYKPVSTRKLRRRGNEPPPTGDKRRKQISNPLQISLLDADIEEDMKKINKFKINNPKRSSFGEKPVRPEFTQLPHAHKRRLLTSPNTHQTIGPKRLRLLRK